MTWARTIVWVSCWAVACAACAPDEPPLGGSGGPTLIAGASAGPPRPRAEPPALAGGTLARSLDGRYLVASDPETDRIWVVNAQSFHLVAEVFLQTGDEPGRVVVDRANVAHVLLRARGEVVSFGLSSGSSARRRRVCAEPRGIAAVPDADAVVVVCGSGEIVTLPSGRGEATSRAFVQEDLRDIVFFDGRWRVSTFKTAEVLTLDAQWTVVSRDRPPTRATPSSTLTPGAAWRTIAPASGGLYVTHVRGRLEPIDLQPPSTTEKSSPYGGSPTVDTDGCSAILHGAVSNLGGGAPGTIVLSTGLPVDVAVSPDGDVVAVASGADDRVHLVRREAFDTANDCTSAASVVPVPARPVGVTYLPGGELVVQTRDPGGLVELGSGRTTRFTAQPEPSAGFDLFHAATAAGGLACASCHPEGTEDGRVWSFADLGQRRTMTVAGGIMQTAPFHWSGDIQDLSHLVSEVFVRRMGGAAPDAAQLWALETFLQTLRPHRFGPGAPAEAISRGEALFQSAQVGCAGCHGASASIVAPADVGTGGVFEVPPLSGLSARAPYLHDGCAATLKDRFGPCGGGDQHGQTSQLTGAEVDDLIAYLRTL